MTPANDDRDARESANEQSESSAGLALRRAREARELSIEDVAEELHLDPAIVVAIESDDLETLGAPVFVKGYLRGYARMLDLNEDEVVAGYLPAEHDPDEFRTVSMRHEVKSGASLSMFVLWAALAALALFALLYLLLGGDDGEADSAADPDFVIEAEPQANAVDATSTADEALANSNAVSAAPPAPASEPLRDDFVIEVVSPAAESMDAAVEITADTAAAEEEVVVAKVEPAVAVEPPPPAEPEPTTVRLALNFVSECWVEVSDSQRRLLYGLEKSGKRRAFDAEPPLKLFFGDASAVEITLDDQSYAIPRAFRTARNTARFTLTQDDLDALR